jgi:hypothetical protein
MATYRHGDAFVLALPDGRFVPGRILLDVRRQCVKPGLVEEDSTLMPFDGTLLVDLYDAVTDTPVYQRDAPLIPGIFVMRTAFRSGVIPIIDHEEVDPLQVAFPESIMYHYGKRKLLRGEVHVPLPEDDEALAQFDLYPGIFPTEQLPDICEALLALPRTDAEGALPDVPELSDLRFSSRRKMVYEAIGEDPEQSYADMAVRYGYDITRFY